MSSVPIGHYTVVLTLASTAAFSTRNIRISTSDGLRLGAWHILPTNTLRDTLERIQATEQHSSASQNGNNSEVGPNGVMNEKTEAIFEGALKVAENVVLYFHGQVGKAVIVNQ
jgi:hypothetical protein